ncbi:hypothetical protein L2755_03640 [Shewanella abyssi]|nr:hypothetical protein [Shewanella abyssi]MCL1048729.1 hypothetical protein [Shewanella abyssi]
MNKIKKENSWSADSSKNSWNGELKNKKLFISGLFIGFAIGVTLGSML